MLVLLEPCLGVHTSERMGFAPRRPLSGKARPPAGLKPPPRFSCREATYTRILKLEPFLPRHLSPAAASFITAALQRDPGARPAAGDLLRHPWVLDLAASAVAGRVPAGHAPQDAPQLVRMASSSRSEGDAALLIPAARPGQADARPTPQAPATSAGGPSPAGKLAPSPMPAQPEQQGLGKPIVSTPASPRPQARWAGRGQGVVAGWFCLPSCMPVARL